MTSEWLQEVRYSVRVLRKSPGFTIVAVLSLALGIGVNTAVLAVARSVLLAPLPVREPDRLAVAYWWRGDPIKGVMQFASGGHKDPATGRNLSSNYDYPTYLALQAAVRDQADLFAFTFLRQANISLEGQPVMGAGMLVSGNYFRALGVPMHLGRGLDARDDRADAEPAAVIGFGMWSRAFGGDPAVIGKMVRVNGAAFTLVGVTARGYFGVSNGGFFPPADVTVPLAAQPTLLPQWTTMAGSLFTSETTHWLRIMARLHEGAARDRVEAALSTAFLQRLSASPFPVAAGAQPPSVRLVDGARGLDSMRSTLETPLMMLGVVAALVFLIACVNIASLMLVRGVARQQEFWIRLALGAGRGRLVRQTIVESLVLAIGGGLLGIVLAVWAGRAIVATIAGATPHAIAVTVDLPLIALAAGVSAVAALFFGVMPSVRLAARNNADLMRQSGAGASAPRLRTGRALVIAQVAIAVPLVIGAALFLRTIHNLASVPLGFEPRGLVIFKMDPTLNGYDEARARQLFQRVIERIQGLPGVRHATLVENALISGWMSQTSFSVAGAKPRTLRMNRVGPGFFEALGVPLVAGRGVGVQDHAQAPRIVVINETAARVLFNGDHPIGRQIVMSRGRDIAPVEVVGVARDAKYTTLKQNAGPTIYLPYYQSTGMGAMHVLVRSANEGQVLQSIRDAVADVDPHVPIAGLKTQQQQINETIGNERAFTTLLVFFGLFALLLACIGLHGVTAYTVARRTSEIGIRLALGAQRRSVLWLILRQVVILAVVGLLIGVPVAWFGSRAVQSLLFGVQPTDPWSIGLGAAVLFTVATAAGFIPARRAARLDPLVALRRE